MLQNNETKFCQSCIERGINPPNPASREWQTNIFYCDECFNAVIENMTSISSSSISVLTDTIKNDKINNGPILDQIYSILSIPRELQYDRVDTVQRNHDKIFMFHAPAIVNRDEESLATEIEQLACALFHIKYRIEPLEQRVKVLKEEKRKEKGLQNYNESKEVYSRPPKKSTVKASQEEKMAKTLGLSLEQYRETVGKAQIMEKKKRERDFNILAGNCPECGGSYPCKLHPQEVLK